MRKKSYRKRMLIMFFAITSAIVILAFISFFSYFINKAIDEKKQVLLQLNKKIASQIETSFYYLDNLALQISANPYIIEKMDNLPKNNNINYFDENLLENKEVTSFLTSYAIKNLFVNRICLYNNDGDLTYFGEKPIDGDSVKRFFSSSRLSDNINYFSIPSNFLRITNIEDDLLFPHIIYPDIEKIISLIRPILGVKKYNYVEVQKSLKSILKLFNIVDNNYHGYLLDGNTIYKANPNSPDIDFSDIVTGKSIFKDKYFISSISIPNTSLIVVLVENSNYFKYNILQLLLFLVLLLFFILAIMFTLEKFIIYKFTNPLFKIAKDMRNFDIGSNEIEKIELTDNDIINSLNDSFAKMQLYVKNSLKREVEAKESEYRSLVLALQSQMDPHFIYNILSVISAVSNEGNMEKVEDICNKLSSILRYSTKYQESNVQLVDEISNVTNYLDLMKSRWENNFTSTISIDDRLLNIELPKFIIQPLVENSFKHGFKKVPAPWHIKINAFITGDYWNLTICDNGCGFDPHSLIQYNKFVESVKANKNSHLDFNLEIGGLGLKNIIIRLNTVFKDDFDFNIKNLDQGCCISFRGKYV